MTPIPQRCDHTSADQELSCQQTSELIAIFNFCFRGIAPYGGTMKRFTENKSINWYKVGFFYQEGA